MMRIFFIATLFLWLMLNLSCTREEHYADALSPEEAIKSFQIHEGFEVEVFAAEPYVQDPVSMVFDDMGNIFVVEMPDYPFKPKEGEAEGRIKKLIDSDKDGRIDKAIVFAEKLSEATSILPWEGGLLVTAAPNIYFMKDTDGDHKADVHEVLFSGFFENNSEAQITNLRFSVDNWIYAANHGQAGQVHYSRKPGSDTLAMQGGDFRFRLDRDTFELATGPTQFGHAIDDWGHRFMTQNTLHIREAVIPKRYIDRNPYFSGTAIHNISDHDLVMFQQTPAPYWRAERSKRRQQQYDEQGLERVEYAEDHFTGASGGTFYSGDAFPEEYYGNIFTGDVAGNLVHRDVLKSDETAPTFIASRHASEKDKEFIASTDPWFRPVNFTVGPDGYLYVIDMYRQHIETPLAIPEDLKEDMDFLNGSDMGRIYRIKPVGDASKSKIIPKLREMRSDQLVGLLANANQWWRLQAQRILLERQDQSIVPEVDSLLQSHQDPRVRLHALYVLEGLKALQLEHIKLAMQDEHPGLREHSIIMAEGFPELLPMIIKCLKDSSLRVAFQASLSLGQFADEQTANALGEIINQKGDDPWFRTAVLSAPVGTSWTMLQKLIHDEGFSQAIEPWKLSYIEDISYAIGAKSDQHEIMRYLNEYPNLAEAWKQSSTTGLLKGLKKHDEAMVKAVVGEQTEELTEQQLEELKTYYTTTFN